MSRRRRRWRQWREWREWRGVALASHIQARLSIGSIGSPALSAPGHDLDSLSAPSCGPPAPPANRELTGRVRVIWPIRSSGRLSGTPRPCIPSLSFTTPFFFLFFSSSFLFGHPESRLRAHTFQPSSTRTTPSQFTARFPPSRFLALPAGALVTVATATAHSRSTAPPIPVPVASRPISGCRRRLPPELHPAVEQAADRSYII